MKILLLLLLLLGVSVLSKELIFLNEEILVIISFLIFLTGLFKFAGASISASLDERSEEINKKFSEIYNLQMQSLEKTLIVYNKVEQFLPRTAYLAAFVIKEVEGNIEKLNLVQYEFVKTRFENKLRAVLAFGVDGQGIVFASKVLKFFEKYLTLVYSRKEGYRVKKQLTIQPSLPKILVNLSKEERVNKYLSVISVLNLFALSEII